MNYTFVVSDTVILSTMPEEDGRVNSIQLVGAHLSRQIDARIESKMFHILTKSTQTNVNGKPLEINSQ